LRSYGLDLKALVAVLIANFKLTSTSLFDFFDGYWRVITISSVLYVEKCRCILLHLRCSLSDGIPDGIGLEVVCPGISNELARQPRTTGKKQSGEVDLVSPLKKLQTKEPDVLVSTSSSTSDTPLPQQHNESSNLSSLLLLSDSSMITTHGVKASPPAVPLPTLSNNATSTKSVSVVELPASSTGCRALYSEQSIE
jgi:hypothetical protein